MAAGPFSARPSSSHRGLSEEEAKTRLAREGPNELARARRRSGLAIMLDVLREPMFLLLIASSVIYALLGDAHQALMLLGMTLLVVGITFYQESKSEHALEALRDLSSPMALVIRDGEQRRIPGREVAPEDILVLAEGDRVAADGLLIAGPGISVDESLLTGESVPVRKDAGGGTEESAVYAGTLVVQGQGVLRVSRTGMRTELGRIGRSLATLATEETALRKETRRLVRLFGTWGAFLCLLVLLAYGWLRHDWMQGLLAGITLAMSVIPEEFPMVLTVFLALGAWRIAKSQVLTRRAPAIEALGAATVLCVDKTGTLTLNRMTVARVVTPDGRALDLRAPSDSSPPAPDEAFVEVLHIAALASPCEGFDPMDRASLEAWEKQAPEGWRGNAQHPLKLYPLAKEWPVIAQVWRLNGESEYIIAAKGAPETILVLCRMDPARQEAILRLLRKMAQSGLRVLGVARARWAGESLPPDPSGFPFDWVGLLGYEDPLRPDVPEAIRACRTAGIRVVMITGDHPETAASIARQAGLDNPDNMMTGALLSESDDDELAGRIRSVSVFARMVPEQKLRLVNALKANREIVAMTGDGVNDAPALKAAHIGIAMGQRGTDVAREAAHLVLLNDDFSSIVQAVRLGRRIFDNLRKAMAYIFSIHIPIAGLSLLPVFVGWPLVLFPAHIAFLEMVIDPACSLAFESEASEKDVMHRPPRPVQEPLFSRWTFLEAALQGSAMLAALLIVYGLALFQAHPEADARTVAFMTLLLCNLMLITVNLSGRVSAFRMPFLKNMAYWWILGSAIAALVLILSIPALRRLFHFSSPKPPGVFFCLLAAVLYLAVAEGIRWCFANRKGKSG